jgi:hypothetical protein
LAARTSEVACKAQKYEAAAATAELCALVHDHGATKLDNSSGQETTNASRGCLHAMRVQQASCRSTEQELYSTEAVQTVLASDALA